MIDELFDRNVAWATGKTRSDPDYFRRLATEPITMVRRHAEEAFAGLSMLEPQLLEEG